MVIQIINPERQKKKQLMETLGIKPGKKYRKWLKKKKKLRKEENLNE